MFRPTDPESFDFLVATAEHYCATLNAKAVVRLVAFGPVGSGKEAAAAQKTLKKAQKLAASYSLPFQQLEDLAACHGALLELLGEMVLIEQNPAARHPVAKKDKSAGCVVV